MAEWFKDVQPDDLTESHAKLAEVVGIEEALKLCEAFGGANVYVPKLDEVYNRVVRNREIKTRYLDGAKIARLATEYGISESTVMRIVRGCMPGQIGIFDVMDGR